MSPSGQNVFFFFFFKKSNVAIILSLGDTSDLGTAVFRLTCSLEIWMGENLLTPFTEGTSLLNRACQKSGKNNYSKCMHMNLHNI